MKEYILAINEKQANTIKTALEEYFRIRMNQWGDLAEDLASEGFTYNTADPENNKKFDAYLQRRDNTRKLLEKAMLAAQPQRMYGVIPVSEECLIAEDIWQVIRHRVYLDNGGKVDDLWNVESRTPLQMSKEPLPVMK